MAKAERNYKDNLFRMIFREKKELLGLYNALNGTNYDNPEELEINTLENAVYTNFKNDISFIIDFEMSLYEHQSTYNANMPLRNLFYVSRLYEKVIAEQTLHTTAMVNIPTPKFFVFYNGIQTQPEKLILRLSDSFQKKLESPELELKVTMLNINAGYNQELLEQCKTLKDYTCYVEKVRKYAGEMNIEDAVNKAVNECIEESILREFLIQQKAEVVSMSILEYDEEKELIKIRRAEYELGVADGIEQGMERGLAEGIKRGIAMGMEQNIRLIRKKFERNMDAASIADILELEAAYVEHVIGLIKENTNASDLEIAEKIRV